MQSDSATFSKRHSRADLDVLARSGIESEKQEASKRAESPANALERSI
jgi:hypothetical protein